MCEEDIKRGGVAATKFAAKGKQLQRSVYADDDSGVNNNGALSYKSSDDVRQLYLKRIEQAEEQAAAAASSAACNNASQSWTLPPGWEDRQKSREVEAKQYGVFGRKNEGQPSSSAPRTSLESVGGASRNTSAAHVKEKRTTSAEEALVRVATHTLDNMASALENNNVALSAEDRAAFAEAMKRAMAAISRCR